MANPSPPNASSRTGHRFLWPVVPRRAFLAAFLVAFLAACRKKTKVARHQRPLANVPAPKVGDVESGIASWYGHPYHGRQAANGEIYDMEKLTAAHRTLPFNTWVRVENVSNSMTVDVRITDRGPFIGNRIIDLSHAAAQKIAMLGSGITPVKLLIIANPAVPEASVFAVQVGLFRNHDNALRLEQQMQTRYGAARIVEREGSVPMYRVLAGTEPTPQSAEVLAVRIRSDISVPEAFVVRLDKP
ncbi:MAG: rare lipoprotein [Bryobacterales bacterium]|nr:rare lipoprotein [Bryobacterales bacterium]